MLSPIYHPPPSTLGHHHLPSRLCCLTAVKDKSRGSGNSFNVDFAIFRASAIPENTERLCLQDNQEKQRVEKLQLIL